MVPYKLTYHLPCRRCRSRKKKCYHAPSKDSDDTGKSQPARGTSNNTTRASSPGHGRVSEYNPESVLEELSETSPAGATSSNIAPGKLDAPFGPPVSIQQSLHTAQRRKRQLLWYKKQRRNPPLSNLSPHYRAYLEEAGAFLQLPQSTVGPLLSLYISCLDDLIPIVDGASLLRASSNGCASRYLLRAVCLVACKVKQAAPFLRVSTDGPALEPLEFATQMLKGLEAAVQADLEPDKVIKIQILSLMYLHNDGAGGGDRSSKYLSQAIHEAWSISLHWDIPGNKEQEQCDFLWWTLRNFDRLNKPVMAAAPFIIDDTDIGILRIEPRTGDYRAQIMSIAISLGDLVKSATKVYKATCQAKSDDADKFPTLDELISGTGFEKFHRMHKCYFQIWYHVAAMLSCRFSGPGTIPYRRRMSSADGILLIASEQGADALPPLPLIPYAVSLSTTMVYRALRDGQREVDLVYRDLLRCCKVLETLSPRWTCVRGVEKLARRLAKLLSEPRGSAGAPPHAGSASDSIVPKQAQETTQQTDCGPEAQYPNTHSTPIQVDSTSLEQYPYSLPEMIPSVSWTGNDVQYFPFDNGFHEMFDGGVPNVFRGHATWEMLNFFGDEESPCAPEQSMFW